LHADLVGPDDCSGCTCRPGKTTCRNAVLTFFATADSCLSFTSQPIDMKTLSSLGQCTAIRSSASGGLHFSNLDIDVTCDISGAAKFTAPVWNDSLRFCIGGQTGKGCGADEMCAPAASAADGPCLMAAGDVACPGGLRKRLVYTGFDDTRSCSCSCAAVGGDCSPMSVSCSDNNSTCEGSGAFYGAGFCGGGSGGTLYCRLEGTPIGPRSCDVSYASNGALTPTGPSTLCCR
jgi:hypothetical protein